MEVDARVVTSYGEVSEVKKEKGICVGLPGRYSVGGWFSSDESNTQWVGFY